MNEYKDEWWWYNDEMNEYKMNKMNKMKEDERVWWMDKDDNDDEDDKNDYYMNWNDISRDKVNELD